MINIFKQKREEEKKIELLYTDKEINRSSYAALLATAIISIPVVLLLVNFFYILMMRPYLAFYLCGLSLVVLTYLFFLFYILCLKKYHNEKEINYRVVLYVSFFYSVIAISIITTVSAFIIIPIFFT